MLIRSWKTGDVPSLLCMLKKKTQAFRGSDTNPQTGQELVKHQWDNMQLSYLVGDSEKKEHIWFVASGSLQISGGNSSTNKGTVNKRVAIGMILDVWL